MLGATGNVDLAPALVVSVDDSTFASSFGDIYDVFVDHLDNVWVADEDNEAVLRFEGLAALTGTHSVVPDLYRTYSASTISNSGYNLYYPISLVVDFAGTLYIGNYDYEMSRFDDALALSGYQDLEASAYLDTGIDYTYMVALDQSGALWVGHYYGELVRLPNPMSSTGYNDVGGDLDLELSWFTSGGSGGPDGGTMKLSSSRRRARTPGTDPEHARQPIETATPRLRAGASACDQRATVQPPGRTMACTVVHTRRQGTNCEDVLDAWASSTSASPSKAAWLIAPTYASNASRWSASTGAEGS